MRYRLNDEELHQVEKLYEELEHKFYIEAQRMKNKIPYIPENGVYPDMGEVSINWWTNGFWAGIMWQMFYASGNDVYRLQAESSEKRLDEALANTDKLDHDIGFMWLPSTVARYHLTGAADARAKGLKATAYLAQRFQEKGEYIKAWNPPAPSCMIIDCLMNIPMLYWADKEQPGITAHIGHKDISYTDIAKKHISSAMKYLIRDDGSCNHIAEFDEHTGCLLNLPAGQGFSEGSSWSRGQSWAIYGMALAYRYSGNKEYLAKAKQIAHYFIANAAVNGYVSLLDFRAPKLPVYYDTTATVCAICGLLELSEHVGEYEKDMYVQAACKMLLALKEHFLDLNVDTDGILQYGSARYQREKDREVPIIYGDYFLIEATLRFLDKDFLIWG